MALYSFHVCYLFGISNLKEQIRGPEAAICCDPQCGTVSKEIHASPKQGHIVGSFGLNWCGRLYMRRPRPPKKNPKAKGLYFVIFGRSLWRLPRFKHACQHVNVKLWCNLDGAWMLTLYAAEACGFASNFAECSIVQPRLGSASCSARHGYWGSAFFYLRQGKLRGQERCVWTGTRLVNRGQLIDKRVVSLTW